ncbi:hypothetical protein Taro_044185 [Colocasia esculenta]|uniref:Uncharacterized protein n=1 Tax=Colocasia esculenta TaxID=4460 RepID=A0A843WTD4_COLES|nr:hypothetical protein [Colocasia esculenta]
MTKWNFAYNEVSFVYDEVKLQLFLFISLSMDRRGKGLETSSLEEPTIGGSSRGAQDTPAGDTQGASATPNFAAFMQ